MIVLAEVGSTAYNIVLFLHIVSAFVAFAPAFVNPVFNALGRQSAPEAMKPLGDLQARTGRTLYLPALIATGILGAGLIVMSDEVWKFSQTWVSIAFAAWIAIGLIVALKIIPSERAVGEGDEAAAKAVAMFGGIAHLLFAVVIYAMVFKPGA